MTPLHLVPLGSELASGLPLHFQMESELQQGLAWDKLDPRVSELVRYRTNDGVFLIDRETENVIKLETPLSSVMDIVRQALEFLAALNRTPAVKLLGISPSGFNATGESDIRNYYDHTTSQQEKVLRRAIQRALEYTSCSTSSGKSTMPWLRLRPARRGGSRGRCHAAEDPRRYLGCLPRSGRHQRRGGARRLCVLTAAHLKARRGGWPQRLS